MSRIVMLAPTVDPSTGTTYYGKDHQMDATDEVWVRSLLASGRAGLMGAAIRQVSVTPIGTTTATVNFTVDQPCTAMKVDYGTTTGYGSSQAATPASGSGAIVASLTGLTTATTYHYRVSVTNAGYVTMTVDGTFRTN